MRSVISSFTICLLLATVAAAQQTFTDVTTINNGSLWVNPPPTGSDAITLYGGVSGPNVLMNASGIELQSGVLSADPGNSANSLWGSRGLQMIYGHDVSATTNRQDVNGFIGLITTGTSQGLGFYTDLVAGTGTSSNAITSNTPLNYVWHRPVSGNLYEDITLRSIPMMLLGGDHNVLKLVHPTDDTQAIILDPYNGTLTVNGSAVLTQAAADTAYATPATVTSQLASLSSQVATNYVSKSATNLGIGSGVTASGLYAVALGQNTTASGFWSFAGGDNSGASGNSSVALGQSVGASGDSSFAAGYWSSAVGNASVALGSWAYAGNEASVALGGPNICAKGDNSFAAGSWSTTWTANSAALGYGLWVTRPNQIALGSWNDSVRTDLPTDLIFVLGNGLEPPASDPYGKYTPYTNPNQSNAIEVQLSGRTTIRNKNYQTDSTAEALNVLGSASVSGNLTVGGSPVLTQAAANTTFATQASVTSQFASLNTQLSTNYVDKSANSLAMGTDATAAGGGWALGDYSIAAGGAISIGTWAGNNGGAASGDVSISLGYASHGFGTGAISMGSYNWAAGENTVSIGAGSYTSSKNSIAVGNGVITYRWGQIVLGTYNVFTENWTDTTLPTDEIFIIGNGTSDTARSNAFVIKRNGDAQLTASLTVQGRRDPAEVVNDPATTKIIPQTGQEVLIPEQGDISMGEFRNGSLPLATP